MRAGVCALVLPRLNSDELTEESSFLESSWKVAGTVPASDRKLKALKRG
jgi:hypothetical protein